jgi:hypothetical protein
MHPGRFLLAASLALMLVTSSGFAGELDFTIVSSSSSLSITAIDTTTIISSAQFTKGTQSGTSSTALFNGTMGVTLSGGTISFGGDTTIAAMLQTGTASTNPLLSIKPGVNGSSTTSPADVGLGVTLHIKYSGTSTNATGGLALRNLTTFVSSTSPLAVTGTTFAASGVGLGISAGEADYSLNASVSTASGSLAFTSSAISNESTKLASITTNGLTTTITIPISLFLANLITTLSADVSVEFTGQIVAQYVGTLVPEPSTLTLLGIGTVGLAAWARYRRRSGSK